MSENKTKIKTTVCWFCGCFIVTIIILVGYLWNSTNTLRDSQERIVTEHLNHVAKVDSIFCDMKKVIISNDSDIIANAPILLSQLQNDSALLRREILLSQAEESNLVALHIDKIDNDYSQIGIWGGVLSILFLIFGFFAIFKIEETKAEAKKTLEDVKAQKEEASAEIKELQDQAVEVNDRYNSIRQSNETFIVDNSNVFNELITTLKADYSQAKEKLVRISKVLVEVESKSEQYDASINQMRDLMRQLAILMDGLNSSNENKSEPDDE